MSSPREAEPTRTEDLAPSAKVLECRGGAGGRKYPLPRTESDPRFTIGLVLDVAKLLKQHGFPELTAANADDVRDYTELQQALFNFIYAKEPA